MNSRHLLLSTLLVAATIATSAIVAEAREANLAPAFARSLDGRLMSEVPRQLREARYLGALAPNRTMRLNVHLAYPHPADVKNFADSVNDPRSPMYGHFLTPAQFAETFAPSRATYAAVARVLEANGIHTWRGWSNRKMLNVQAPASAIERFFHTRLGRLAFRGREHVSNLTPAIVPDVLRGSLVAVTGLDDFEVPSHLLARPANEAHPHALATPIAVPVPYQPVPVPAAGVPAGISPHNMQTAYNYPYHTNSKLDGKGVTIAIEAAYGFSPADINYFWGAFNVVRTGTLSTVDPDGNVPPPLHPTDSAEVTVDVEQSTSNAPGADEKVFTVPAALTIMLEDTYNAVVTDPTVDVVSTSFGNCETNAPAIAADNDEFQQGSIEGQTMFAAAGDTGSNDCRANGPDVVDFPASSPEVGAAGGTTLVLNGDETIKNEQSWSCLATTGTGGASCGNGAAGGGVSGVFTLPAWQRGLAASASANSKVSATMRNVPDVSLNADLNTSYAVFFTGTATLGYGGTSLVGPNLAAIYAQIESGTKHRMGRSSTSIYYAYAMGKPYGTGAFHDITIGNNLDTTYTGGTGFSAFPGFDDASGWGSLDATALMKSLPAPVGPANL